MIYVTIDCFTHGVKLLWAVLTGQVWYSNFLLRQTRKNLESCSRVTQFLRNKTIDFEKLRKFSIAQTVRIDASDLYSLCKLSAKPNKENPESYSWVTPFWWNAKYSVCTRCLGLVCHVIRYELTTIFLYLVF